MVFQPRVLGLKLHALPLYGITDFSTTGPVVRCGPNHLTFNEPDLVATVYHRKADKTDFHQEFSCPQAVFNQKRHCDHLSAKRNFGHAVSRDHLFCCYEQKHLSYHILIFIVNRYAYFSFFVQFSLSRVALLESALDEQIEKWLSILNIESLQNTVVDWERWAR